MKPGRYGESQVVKKWASALEAYIRALDGEDRVTESAKIVILKLIDLKFLEQLFVTLHLKLQ